MIKFTQTDIMLIISRFCSHRSPDFPLSRGCRSVLGVSKLKKKISFDDKNSGL